MKFLSASLRIARIRGMDIRFHFSMLFSVPIAYYLFKPTEPREMVAALFWLLGFVACILLHELGHAFVAQFAGIEVRSIVIWILGGFTNLSRKSEKPARNLAVAAAGPLVNMLLGFFSVAGYIIFSIFFLPFYRNTELFLWGQTFVNLFLSLAFVNVVLVAFNLLPVYPLDGGNILHSAMEMFFGKTNADLITLLISIPVLLALIVFALVIGDYLLLASCVLIGVAVGTLNKSFLRWVNLGINYVFKRSGYYYLEGDFERAIPYYTADIEREPGQPAHYLARAACYLNTLQNERAKADVDRALKLAPNLALALQLRGELHAVDKDYASALDFFDRAQRINPNWAVPYFDRGSVHLEQKDFPSALAELNKSISLMPQAWLFYLVRSIVHFRLGDLDAAHRDQDSAISQAEKDALVMADLNLPMYEGCLDWAEDFYTRILSKQPNSGYAFQGRADAYRINDQHEKAIADYTRAIELMPKEARLYLGRGRSFSALNETERSISDYRQAAALADKIHLKRQAEELLKTF
ncbi:MAG: site-2 protease family protein [Anaerolineales bacterium]|nr:site-2 protease family protein [Anaerolineales bacterium]